MALALTGRVGAVAAHLQFAAENEPAPGRRPRSCAELADCLVYLVGLTDALGFDVLDEAVGRISAAVADGARGKPPMPVAEHRPLPFLQEISGGSELVVDGRPVLMLGGQLHSSSPSSRDFMRPVWDRLASAGVNAVIGSASSAQVEPVEGTFDSAR